LCNSANVCNTSLLIIIFSVVVSVL
jgi:hypothetical protein